MKQTELKRTGGPKRKPMKRTQPKRDWTAAREKVEDEDRCRFYGHDLGCAGPIEAAHIIGREHDKKGPDPFLRKSVWWVNPLRVVPLCKFHHDRYDGRDAARIDLLPALTLDEQLQAVLDAGGLELARKRLCPTAYRPGVPA